MKDRNDWRRQNEHSGQRRPTNPSRVSAPRGHERRQRDVDDDQDERELGGQGYLGGYDLEGNPYGGNSLYGASGTTGETARRGGQGYMGGFGLVGPGGGFGRYGDPNFGGNFGNTGRSWRPEQPGRPRFPRGPKGYQRSDERIREDLCDRLMVTMEIDSSDVEVKVKDGEVALTGTVPDREMKHAIERLADGVAGVNDISNQLKVRSPKESGGK